MEKIKTNLFIFIFSILLALPLVLSLNIGYDTGTDGGVQNVNININTDSSFNDTNASTACTGTDYLGGDGNCYSPSVLAGDTNETTRFENLVGTDCSGTDKMVGVDVNGNVVCAADQVGSGGAGNPFDQSLNTTDDVTFNKVTVTQNVSASWFLGNLNWSDVQNKLIESIDTIYFYISGGKLYFNETKLNNTIDSRDSDTLNSLSCSDNQIAKWNSTSNQWECAGDEIGAGGTGDITAVNTPGNYLYGGASVGDVNLYFNETLLNNTIDARSSGGGSNYYPTQINLTTTTYNGSLSAGGYTGYKAGDYICDQLVSGSHFCTEFEIAVYQKDDINNEDAWAITGSPKYIPADVPVNDCHGWTHGSAGTYLGNYWHFDSSTGGDGRAINCGTTLKLACCKY